MTSTGADLRLRRLLAGIPQFWVAQKLGLPQSRLSEIELEKRTPSPELTQSIKEAIAELAERKKR